MAKGTKTDTGAALTKANKAAPAKAKKGSKRQASEVTEEEIRPLREQGLSWRDIAATLNLGSAGSARTAWKHATGQPHTTAPGASRRPAVAADGTGQTPAGMTALDFSQDTPSEEVAQAINERIMYVRPMPGFEKLGVQAIPVLQVLRVYETTNSGEPCPLAVDFLSGEWRWDAKKEEYRPAGEVAYRTVRAELIMGVR